MGQVSKSKLQLLVMAMIAIICISFTGCKNSTEQTSDGNEADTSEITETVTDDNGEQFALEEEKGKSIETKYMTFYMPEDLENELSVVSEKTRKSENLTFSTDIAGETLELFSITLSKEEQEGYKMGILEDNKKGDIIITIQVNEQQAEDWSDKDFVKINKLQERVNDFIYQLSEDDRYVPQK